MQHHGSTILQCHSGDSTFDQFSPSSVRMSQPPPVNKASGVASNVLGDASVAAMSSGWGLRVVSLWTAGHVVLQRRVLTAPLMSFA